MIAPFHYLIKAKVIRLTESNEPSFEEISKKFESTDPILAREEAFRIYQNWVDVLLESKNEEYISDRQARKELLSFIDPEASTKLYSDINEIEFNKNTFGNGIGVFFVIDELPGVDYTGSYNYWDVGDELLIHGIGNLFEKYMSEKYLIDRTVISLQTESDYYKYFSYETKNKEINIAYCMWMCWYDGVEEKDTIQTYNILKTPFNWEGYDKLFWWGKKDAEAVKEVGKLAIKSIKEIIEKGESNRVEFKSSLLYNLQTELEDKAMKEMVAKTICAFLNSSGGFLFIGVNDDGSVRGLDLDFSLSKGKNAKDYFKLNFDDILKNFLGISKINWINGDFYEINGREIFVVEVFPCKTRPVFLTKGGKKIFYVRLTASTREIADVEEIFRYWLERDKLAN